MKHLLITLLLFLSISKLLADDPDRLEVIVLTENNLCDGDLSNNGSAFAVIFEDDGEVDDDIEDYTINWYFGPSSGTPVHVGHTYDQMAEGTYTVTVTHDESSFTDEVVVTINRTEEGPDAYVDQVKNAKNCKENDGSAKVRVYAEFPSEDDYDFDEDDGVEIDVHSHDNIKDCKHGICWNFVWYEGNNPFIGDVVAVGADAKDLKPGTYAVVVTNESTGCQTVVGLSVGLDSELPEVDGTVDVNITDCADPNVGSLTAFVPGEKSNKYEFDWYIGNFIKDAPDFNNQETITGLAAGNYTVVAKEKSSGCSGNPITLTVQDLTSTPVISTNLDSEQTSCDPANPTGAVSATADGATSGYNFEWFQGQNTLAANLIGNGPSLTGLSEGFYTVRATNTSDPNSQNCFSTEEIRVTEALTNPSDINGAVTDQSYCVNPNGEISADVSGTTAGYTFYWFDGNIASPDTNNSDFTGATYSNLSAGDYTLVVEDNSSSCSSTTQVFTVEDLSSLPTIALASSSDLTSCDSPNGAISVTADGGTSGYNFRWFTGSSTADSDEITPSPGASIGGLSTGNYTVLAENQTTGCFNTFEHTVQDQRDYPVVSTTIIDQTQCDPVNGEIQANVGGATAGYNFYWFNGNVASPDISAPDLTGATISTLTAGEYTLIVEDDASKCTSPVQVLTVEDLTPNISATITLDASQSSCDTSAPNGALSASASGGSSYTFEWFNSSNTSVGTGASISGLSAQTYRLVATDAGGCTDEVTYALPSAIVLPAIDIDNIVSNTICDPALSSAADYDGEIEASIGGTTAGYTFYWFDGDVASPDITSADYTGSTYSNLASGDYTLVVVEDATTCESDREVVTVPDATPTIGGTITLDASQTSCDAAAPNGELTALGSGGTSYTYAWYPGTDTSDPSDIIVSTANITGLSAQTYTVVITDQATGCSEELSRVVPSAIVLPAIDIDNIVSNTICDPALSSAADYDGEIEASIGGTTAGYTFYWFDGDVASPDITSADYTGSTYSNLASGDYTLVVVEDATTCESDREVVTVPDATPTIGGTITLDASQTSCDPAAPNGELTALGSGGTSYTYAWYPGTDTSDPSDIIVSTANITGLSAQTYTVVITDQATGCSEELSRVVPSAIVLPAIDIDNIVSNTICDPALSSAADYDGEIEASIGGTTASYTFYWFDGDVASPDITSADYTGSTYSNLASGDYTLVVVEDATTCESDREVVTVPDATPTIGGTITLDASQTSCDPAAPNGELTALGSGGTSYTYAWYPGTDTSDPSDIIVSTANITGLSAQTYTVVITDQATGCSEELSRVVPSAIVLPAIDIDNIVSNTICDPGLSSAADYDGEIEASIGGTTAGYTFYWFDGDVASPDITSADYTGSTYSNLASGDYTLVVVEDATTCESDREVVTVPDATPTIGGTITLDASQTSCDPAAPNGELTALGSGGTSYTYAWYPGTDTSDPSDIIVSTANITGLSAQTYTVVITDQATGCSEELSRVVPSAIVLPAIDIDNIVSNTICDPGLSSAADYDGEIEASIGGTTAGYTFYWFDGDVASPDITSADYTGSTYSNLASGDYTLVVVEDATTCESDREVVTVPDATPTIGGTITLDASQTSCDAAAPNGELTALGSGGTSYTYAWYPGTDTSDPSDIIVSTANITGLSAQTYTVVITDQATGCSEELSQAVPNDIKKPVLNIDPTTDITANSVCDPALTSPAAAYNGAITSSVEYDGAAGDVNDYLFEWYVGTDTSTPFVDGTDGVIAGVNGETITQLNAGDYTLVATKVLTAGGVGFQCSSESITVTVVNDLNDPTASINKDALQTSCGAPKGQLTATGASGSGSYGYEWFVGNDVSTAFNDGVDGDIIGANDETIQNIAAGDYSVRVTDLTTGCQTTQNIYLDENIIDPVVTLSVTTAMTDCSFDGVITPTITSANAAPSGHNFTWHAGQSTADPVIAVTTDAGASNPELSTTNTGTTIYSGYYTVVVTDIFTGCVSNVETIFLDRPAPQFSILTNVNVLPSTCGVDEGILTAWVDLDGDANPSLLETDYTSYTFEWYIGNPTDLAANYYTNPGPVFSPNTVATVDQNGIFPGSVPGSAGVVNVDYFGPENANAGATFFGRESGQYTVVVTDKATGCKEFIGVDIGFNNGAEVVVAEVDIIESTSCAADNGSLEVTDLANIPGGQSFSDYTYNWYEGTNEDIGNEILDGGGSIITTALLNQNGATMGLTPGYYTVVPEENFGSGCRLTPFTVFLDSAYRQPLITVTTLDPSTSCVGNGTIAVAGSKDADDSTPAAATPYSYLWNTGATTATISGLSSGDYTVTVTDNQTGCSRSEEYTIRDERVVPEISSISAIAQSYCSPLNGALQITDADMTVGGVNDYTYTVYFEGTNAGDIVTPTITYNAADVEIEALNFGTYYIKATKTGPAGSDGEGCTTALKQIKVDNELDAVVLTLSQTANTACDQDPNSDATLTLNMSTPSLNGAIAGADYQVSFTAIPGDAMIASSTANVTSGYTFEPAAGDLITPGVYTVQVVNNTSGCSITRSITVEDNPEPIVFSRSDLTVLPQQLCNPDGEISVSSISPGAVGEYTYTWYEGSVAAANIVGGTGPVLNSGNHATIGAGIYYVVANRIAGNNPGSGCSSVAVRVEIPKEQVKPVLSLSQTANTSCDPDPNSDATLTVEMETPSPTAGILNSTYTIDFVSVPTVASVASFTTGAGPGPLSVTFPQAASDLIMPGSYEVMVTNDASNCSITRSITVEDNPEPIVFSRSDLTVLPQQLCNPDGEISVSSISPGAVGEYTYTWYEGSVAAANIVGGTGPVLNSGNHATIGAGIYYVVANRIAGNNPGSGCSSVAVRVEIPKEQVKPVLSLSQTANTSCDPDPNSDATLTVEMETPSPTAGILNSTYTIDFVSVPTVASVASFTTGAGPGPLSVTFPQAASDLIMPGSYEVMVTNDASNCSITRSITVEDNPEPIVFSRSDLTVLPQQLCNPDGEISISSISPGAVGEYTYTWYEGSVAAANIVGGTGPVLNSGNHATIGAGIYYVVANRIAGNNPGSGCSSVAVRVEIPDEQVKPVLTLSQTANTSCDPDPNSDATLTVEMETPSPTAGILNSTYTIDFVSVPTDASVASFTTGAGPGPLSVTFPQAASDLIMPGSYEVMVTNDASNCSITRSITVEDNPEPIVFSRSDLTVLPQQLCNPDGEISVSSISPGAVGEYTYTWYEGSVAPANIVGGTGPVLNSGNHATIGAGIYYVVANRIAGNNPGSGCSSVAVRVEIPDEQVDPILTLSQTANTSCDPDPNSDATLTVEMETPSPTAGILNSTYTIDFVSVPTDASVASFTTGAGPGPLSVTFPQAASDLIMPGSYEVMVTNDASNCSITRSITVEDNPEPIVFSRSDLTVLPQQLCNPDGEISVSSISPGAVGEYTYTWYEGSVAPANIVGGTGPVLNSGNHATIGAGIYYVVANRIAGNNPGSGCSSVAVRVEIPNEQVKPVLTLSQTANTSCDPDPNSDATLTVEMETPSPTAGILNSTYTIEFVSVPTDASVAFFTTGAGPGPLSVTFPQAASDLIMPGSYEVMVTNDASNCSITRSITVEDNPEPIVFSRSDLDVRGSEYCVASGSIQVVSISPNLPAGLADYSFRWYKGKANYDAGTSIAGVTGPVLDSTTYAGIAPGVYYVEAARGVGISPASSCTSVGVRVELPDSQVEPVLSLSQTANTACDPNPNSDATISVTMSAPSSNGPISGANYDIRFISRPADATVADVTGVASPYTFTSSAGDLILPGLYEIEIFNKESECTVTRSIDVEDNPEPITLSKADITVGDATDCTPSGSITVNSINPVNISNYTFRWYAGESNYTGGTVIAGENTNAIANLSPGEYYVEAVRTVGENPGSTCVSNVVRVEILDAAIRPDIVIVENAPNSSCDPSNPNGSISASVNGEPLSDFTYEWFIGLDNTSNPIAASLISGSTGETASGLAAGNYTVRVTDNTSPGNTCSSTKSFFLREDFTVSLAKNVSFDITPQSDCFDSGAITVSSLTPGSPSDFEYEWYYENFETTALISGENSSTLSNRAAGTYYLLIINQATDCQTDNPIQVEIPFTANSPAVELLDAKPNTDCDPNTPDGFLEVSADGGQTADYSFRWFEGQMPVATDAAQVGNGNRINALDSGYYTVVVQSTITNCIDTAQFYVEFLPELPKISLTTSPVTNCGSPNGSAYAQIYNMDGNFLFNWYIGTSVKSQADFTGPWQTGLPVGDYVVEAIDLDAAACVSQLVNFTIDELIEVPQLKLNQISPNTYCDPEKVNGLAEVILYYVDEDDDQDTVFVTSNFEVLWYRNESFPSGPADYTGRINGELAATDYTVTYRNLSTNCIWENNITITEDLRVIQPPEVNIIELFDSCEEPNGVAEISSSNFNSNYIYSWYFEQLSDTPDFISNQVNELDLGTYLVTATDTVSGCISSPMEVEITDGRKAPVISLSLEPEMCGEYDGKATISINDDYEYRSIEWDTPYGPAFGTSYDQFTSGQYSVIVTGSNGCEYTEEFIITSEINVFNGLSPNNDGQNDVWEIGCLSGFENNSVEIYNRAGVLVFTTRNYGNGSNDFMGYGNRGIYAGEKKLPDGTYFYVINKGDGSDPVTGYLELFR